MSEQHRSLLLTVRFLQRLSHGRGQDHMPEWPPSPLRLFQAMVANGVGRAPDPQSREATVAALRWLEALPAPEILAPPLVLNTKGNPRVTGYRSYVPDNIGDVVARSWSAGRDAKLESYRAEKDVRSVLLEGELVVYRYVADAEGLDSHLRAVAGAMRALTHLGWGIDMVVGDAGVGRSPTETNAEHWLPGRAGERALRRPVAGTLDALERRHGDFLRRFATRDTFVPVGPLGVYAEQHYARTTYVPERPVAAFRLVEPISGDRLSFDPERRARDVSAWLRHRAGQVAEGWPYGDTRGLIYGHGDAEGSADRISYIPVPTVLPPRTKGGKWHVGDIARVLLTGPPGRDAEVLWLRDQLLGTDLQWADRAVATLEFLPEQDWVLGRYLPDKGAMTWTTVTPVVLPGFDDGAEKKTEKLIRKALRQAGLGDELAEQAELDWGGAGFLPGLRHARAYVAPDKVVGPQVHVRARFPSRVRGPLAIGSGRHRGVGTFVALEAE